MCKKSIGVGAAFLLAMVGQSTPGGRSLSAEPVVCCCLHCAALFNTNIRSGSSSGVMPRDLYVPACSSSGRVGCVAAAPWETAEGVPLAANIWEESVDGGSRLHLPADDHVGHTRSGKAFVSSIAGWGEHFLYALLPEAVGDWVYVMLWRPGWLMTSALVRQGESPRALLVCTVLYVRDGVVVHDLGASVYLLLIKIPCFCCNCDLRSEARVLLTLQVKLWIIALQVKLYVMWKHLS